MIPISSPLDIPNLLCFWDFQTDLTSHGPHAYTFEEMNGPVQSVENGVFGPRALQFELGQWLRIRRADCPALDIHGAREASIAAWVQRRSDHHWQYIAGVWDEGAAARQYALFTCGHKQSHATDLSRTDADNRAHGYVSEVGGATPDCRWCFSYATGGQSLEKNRWHFLVFTYDLNAIRVYVNGELDPNGDCNPFPWDKPIFDGGIGGADFTVAQRNVRSWPDYPRGRAGNRTGFDGLLGGVAVFDRALKAEEIGALHAATRVE